MKSRWHGTHCLPFSDCSMSERRVKSSFKGIGKESHSSAYSLRFGLRILCWNQSVMGSLAPSSIDSADQPTFATMSRGRAVWEITQIIFIASKVDRLEGYGVVLIK